MLDISAVALVLEFGFEIGMVFATAALLNRQGFTTNIGSEVRLLFVKPRAAPFIGLLGLFHERWLEDGVDSLIVDGVLSYFAGPIWAFNLSAFRGISRTKLNPAQPKGVLVMFIGAFLIIVPSTVVGTVVGIITMVVGLFTCNILTALVFLVVIVFLICLPFLAIVEAVKKIKGEKLRLPLVLSRRFAKACYIFFVLSSIVINVGNWLTFSEFFIQSGDLWCPGDLSAVTVFWWIFPFLAHIILLLYRTL
jgi:hypothetical protein